MKIKPKKIAAVLLSLSLMSNLPAVFAEEQIATRGEVVQALLTAADDYNPTVQKTDIIKGYEDGQLHEDWEVTRAEALVMLKRAFGALPTPEGHNARVAIPAESFSDIPDWAESELANVFGAGIVAGTEDGIFSPDEFVTNEQMDLFIERVYSLFGTNVKDDFYAAVNKEALDNMTIKPGRIIAGTLYDLDDESTNQVSEIIKEVTLEPHEKGTKEQKIADYYNNILDMDARNKAGVAPIKKYLDLVDSAKTTDDLIRIQSTLAEEIELAPFMTFGLTTDLKDSTKYILCFAAASPRLSADFYSNDTAEQKEAYLEYAKTLLVLGGETESDAENMAQLSFEFEKILSEAQMNREDYADADKIYNIFSMQEIKDIFDNVDMEEVFKDCGLKPEERICITDVGLTKAFAEQFNNDNIEALKSYAKLDILFGWGGALNQEFIDASDKFNADYLGVDGTYTDEERAAMMLKNSMPDYIGEIYAEKYFSEEAKQDVEKMVRDIIEVYRNRIKNVTWMSDATKEKAIKKLDTMGVKIGYPDDWETYLDNADILSASEGGSYFANTVSIMKAQKEQMIDLQGQSVDKSTWYMYPYTVNACYVPTSNDITFPAAILQAPMYDVNASYEQNLGGIGYIIAHEITHAFDNNGAKYDENGNAADWWEPQDYEAFQNLCDEMSEFYDGEEGVPGIPIDGTLTLSENVADQGAVACITEIAAGLDNPDFKALYESMARCWASTATREYYQYAVQVDFHSTDKLRVNRTVVNCDEFYEAFDIDENDGMYLSPEERVRIW